MPFKSEKQRRFMFANHPKIAHRWAHEGRSTMTNPMFDSLARGARNAGAGGIGRMAALRRGEANVSKGVRQRALYNIATAKPGPVRAGAVKPNPLRALSRATKTIAGREPAAKPGPVRAPATAKPGIRRALPGQTAVPPAVTWGR